jgi:D-glycero-D-manno-heptose 1,7-bisphosphate phosphatase
MAARRFVLLDRDGTVNVERHYLSAPEQLCLLPGAAEGMRQMRAMGLGLAIVTNQSGVGRGFFDLARLAEIHDRLRAMLHEQGVELDGVYFCPHAPETGCVCRKPLPGLIHQAAAEHGFVPHECIVIGDKACDLALGHAVGAQTILVRTGYGVQAEAEIDRERAANSQKGNPPPPVTTPDHIANDLASAAAWIASHLGSGS